MIWVTYSWCLISIRRKWQINAHNNQMNMDGIYMDRMACSLIIIASPFSNWPFWCCHMSFVVHKVRVYSKDITILAWAAWFKRYYILTFLDVYLIVSVWLLRIWQTFCLVCGAGPTLGRCLLLITWLLYCDPSSRMYSQWVWVTYLPALDALLR